MSCIPKGLPRSYKVDAGTRHSRKRRLLADASKCQNVGCIDILKGVPSRCETKAKNGSPGADQQASLGAPSRALAIF